MSEAPKPLDAALDLFVYVPVGLAMTAAEELPKLAAKGRTRVNNQLAMARVVGQFAVAKGRQMVEARLANPVPAPPAPTSTRAPGSRVPSSRVPSSRVVDAEPVTFDDMTGQGSGAGESRLAAITPIEAARNGGGAAVEQSAAAEQDAAPHPEPAPDLGSSAASEEVLPGADTVDAEGGVTVSTVGDLGSAAPDRATLAIPGYDSLSASQVVQRLAGLNQEELAAVGAYEQAHRGRRTVLNRVDQLRGA